jgi:hypothetical protein
MDFRIAWHHPSENEERRHQLTRNAGLDDRGKTRRCPPTPPSTLAPPLVDRISDAVGSNDDQPWRTQCIKRLGHGAVDWALGQLKEARQLSSVRNPGDLLTKVFKDIAIEAGIAIH